MIIWCFAALERNAVESLAKWRSFSNLPEHTVYSGPTASAGKRVTLRTLRQKYEKNEPLSMVTAYDYPSAVHVRFSDHKVFTVCRVLSFRSLRPHDEHDSLEMH